MFFPFYGYEEDFSIRQRKNKIFVTFYGRYHENLLFLWRNPRKDAMLISRDRILTTRHILIPSEGCEPARQAEVLE